MTDDELNQIREIVKEEISSHLHGVNAARIPWKGVKVTPATALTIADSNVADATYGTVEANLINNHTARINEIEIILQNLKLLE